MLTKTFLQPGGLNWANPLARGLVGAWMPQTQADGLADLVGQHGLSFNGQIGPGVNTLGRVLSARGGKASVLAGTALRPAQTVSLFWCGTFDGPADPGTWLLGVGDGTGPSYALTRGPNGPGLVWGGQTIASTVSTAGPLAIVGTVNTHGGATLYVNGAVVGSVPAGGGSLAYRSGSTLHAPGSPGNGNAAASVAVQYIYDRELTPDDVGALVIDPYAPFRQPRRRLYTVGAYTPMVVGSGGAVVRPFTGTAVGRSVPPGIAGNAGVTVVGFKANAVGTFQVEPRIGNVADTVQPFVGRAKGEVIDRGDGVATVNAFVGRAQGGVGAAGKALGIGVGTFRLNGAAGHGVADFWRDWHQPIIGQFRGAATAFVGDYVGRVDATVDPFQSISFAVRGVGADTGTTIGLFRSKAAGQFWVAEGIATAATGSFIGAAAGRHINTGHAWTQVDAWTGSAAGSLVAYVGAAADLLGMPGGGQGRVAPTGRGSATSLLPTAVALAHVFPSIVGANSLQTIVGSSRTRVANWPPFDGGS